MVCTVATELCELRETKRSLVFATKTAMVVNYPSRNNAEAAVLAPAGGDDDASGAGVEAGAGAAAAAAAALGVLGPQAAMARKLAEFRERKAAAHQAKGGAVHKGGRAAAVATPAKAAGTPAKAAGTPACGGRGGGRENKMARANANGGGGGGRDGAAATPGQAAASGAGHHGLPAGCAVAAAAAAAAATPSKQLGAAKLLIVRAKEEEHRGDLAHACALFLVRAPPAERQRAEQTECGAECGERGASTHEALRPLRPCARVVLEFCDGPRPAGCLGGVPNAPLTHTLAHWLTGSFYHPAPGTHLLTSAHTT